MKKRLLFVSLFALLAACGEVQTSTLPASSSTSTSEATTETTTSETTTSETTTSEDSSEDSSSIIELSDKEKALVKLRSGFTVKTTFSKQYDEGTPSKSYYIDYIGNEVVKSKKFSDDKFEKVSQVFQYEKNDSNLADSVSYNIDGSIVRTPLMLEDSLIRQDVEADWSIFENAFLALSEDDFTLEDQVMSLSMKDDNDFTNILNRLSAQLYMYIDGYSTHYFVKQAVTAFSLTIDDTFTPTNCSLTYEEYDSYGSTVKSSLACEFLNFGEEVEVSKIEAKTGADKALDDKLALLQKQNYKGSFYRKSYDWMSDGLAIDTQGEIISDGKGNFEINKTKSSVQFIGYKKVDETHYQKYKLTDEVYTKDGEELEGTIDSLLPSFKISSAFFTKEETETGTIFTFVLDELMSTKPTVSCFCGFDGAIANNQTFATMTITLTNTSVTFHNDTGGFVTDVEYTLIGEVEEISRTLA